MSPVGFKDILHSTRTAIKWERLRRILTPKDKLGIILYGEPDPDALGSAWALQHLLKKHIHTSTICSLHPVEREQNVKLVKALGIPVEVYKTPPWDSFDKIAIVDAQPDFFAKELSIPRSFDIVIDHHPKKDTYSFKFSDVRPTYGSVSTILLEYLLWANVHISKKLATALWFGLRTDTNNLTTDAHEADVSAYGYLYKRSDRNLLLWLEREEIPISYGPHCIQGLHALEKRTKNKLIHIGKIDQPDVCVHVADLLARFIGVKAIVVMGETKDTLFVIMRAGSYATHVGRLARKLEKYGSAGGHKSKARAEIPLSVLHTHLGKKYTTNDVETWMSKLLWRTSSSTH